MKVLIVTSGLPSEKYPLLDGMFALDQAKALAQKGVDVIVFSIDLRSIKQWRHFGVTSKRIDGIECYDYSIPVGPFGDRILDYLGNLCAKRLYKRVFADKSRPSIIHAHFASSYGVCLSGKYNIPLVITEHSSQMNRTDLPVQKIERVKRFYSRANTVVTVSSLLANSLLEKTGTKCEVIHNIIDTTLFSRYERKDHQHFNFVTTAILTERKRVHQLLPVIKKCPNNVHLIIIGDGPERSRIDNIIKEYDLGNRVSMMGYQSREDTAKIYEKCDCFVLPSSLETFGVVYVEAMAAGLPVIATRCGGPEDFVEEKNGVLIDVDNSMQLENAMQYMILHAQEYTPNTIKEFVQDHFSPEVIADKLIDLYSQIVK